MTAFNQLIEQKDELIPGMKIALERALGQSNGPRVAEIDEKLEALQKELVKKANANQGVEALADEIEALREEKQSLLLEDADRAGMRKRFDEIEAFLEGQSKGITDYAEVMVRQLIKKITVSMTTWSLNSKPGMRLK